MSEKKKINRSVSHSDSSGGEKTSSSSSHASKSSRNNKKKTVELHTMISSVAIILVVALLVLAVAVYFFGTNNKISKYIINYVPFPAVVVEYSNPITFGEIQENLASIKSFYENQDFSKLGLRVDFSTPEGEKKLKIREAQLINKMIEDKVIRILAEEEGIKVSKEAVSQNVSRKLKESGNSKKVQETLEKLYGWSLEDFQRKIVEPEMYKEELEKKILSKKEALDYNEKAKDKIEEAEKDIKNDRDFSEIVKNISQGSTSDTGGELGWFKKEQLIEGLANEVFSLEPGEITGILESRLGYHIIKIQDKKEEDNESVVKISQIFVTKYSFINWIEERMKEMTFWIWSKEYYWDEEKLIVEFKDKEFQDYRDETLKEFQGDVTLGF